MIAFFLYYPILSANQHHISRSESRGDLKELVKSLNEATLEN